MKYIVEAGLPSYKWEGHPTYSVSARLEIEAADKAEAIEKWEAIFSTEEKAMLDMSTLKVSSLEELPSMVPYYTEGRRIFFDGRRK